MEKNIKIVTDFEELENNPIQDLITKQSEQLAIKWIEFIKQCGYNSFKQMVDDWYKIDYKITTENIEGWIKATMTPYLQEIITFEDE